MTRLSILFLFLSLPCFAQKSTLGPCYDKAQTQAALNVCASEDAKRADVVLNNIYRKLLSQVTDQPEAAAKIKMAEKAWIAYRDAYIDATYPAKDKQAEYGTMYPMEVDLLYATLTRRQVTALKEMLQSYASGK